MKTIARILNNIRLGAFPIAYGLSGALIGGTLNRIMIAEMQLPASLVGFFFAIPLLVSPVRIWLGYRSDGYPLLGRRREPYIMLGAILIGLGIFATSTVAVNTYNTIPVLLAGEVLAFLLYGLGRNLGHNSYQALLTERYSRQQRTRAATFYEVVTLFGAVAGAGFVGKALEVFEPAKLVSVAVGVGVVVVLLAIFASIGQEQKGQVVASNAQHARQLPFKQVLRDFILSDPQVRVLFGVVIFTFIGTLAQDALLEPFGALVLNMSVGETTRLTMFWGLGVMFAMLLSGFILLKWLGHLRLMRVGIIASALVFVGLIATGAMGNPSLFKGLVFVMGVGTGLAGAGMLSSVISFTTPVRAGMLLGVWGVANMLGHAFGNLMGGIVVDTMRLATGSAFAAYSTLFALETVMLVAALFLSTKLDLNASRAYRETDSVISAEAAAD